MNKWSRGKSISVNYQVQPDFAEVFCKKLNKNKEQKSQ